MDSLEIQGDGSEESVDIAVEAVDEGGKDILIPSVSTAGNIYHSPEKSWTCRVTFIRIPFSQYGEIWMKALQIP